jgi:hypothetical protein
MISRIESGINTYVGHFNLLIGICEGFGSVYNPRVQYLMIASLKTQAAGIQTAINKVDQLLPVSVTAENARAEKFVQLAPLATRVQAAAIVLGLPDAILVHIKEVVRKIRGQRAQAIKDEGSSGSAGTLEAVGSSDTLRSSETDSSGETGKHRSVSQKSFNEQIEHLNQLIMLVSSQTTYTPAEADLSVSSLNSFLNAMRTTNDAAVKASFPLTNARMERDKLLYAPKTGMMDTALAVKEYVKSVFGAKSPQYKEVQRIRFRNIRK